jgi:thiol-disulfide isomerase/thioredoxin
MATAVPVETTRALKRSPVSRENAMTVCRLACGLLLAIAARLLAPGGAWAEETLPTQGANAAGASATAPVKKSRYDLPEGGVEELLAFVKDIRAFKPTTPAEKVERSLKLHGAVERALAKIAEIATADDKQLAGFDDAIGLHLVFRTMAFAPAPRGGTPEQKQQLIEDIKSVLLSSPRPAKDAVSAARKVSASLESAGDKEQAARINRQFGGILADSTDAETAEIGAKMIGAARRLELIGKPFELAGTLVDGAKLDWATYRGRVVLVDFWATWCRPCRAEMPNIRRCYEDYHARGFDVVGISLDEDRQLLEKFLADEKFPWPTMHDGGPSENPTANAYGIWGVNTAILVDRQGAVVSLAARGQELRRQLEMLLGPADENGARPSSSGASEK